MRRLLESIIHNRKLYNRPQDEWTCGRADEGCPCLYGPGKKGECRATCQCQPARKGDRWVCTRQISLGGACSTGPMPDGKCGCPVPPCQPKRSLRGHRRRLTWLAIFAALGGAILILGGKNRAEWNSPGPITSQHATSAQRCTDCHTEPNLPPLTPAGVAAHTHTQNEKCLTCHELGPQPAMPHGVGATRMAQLTAARASDPAGPAILAVSRALTARGETELACASCHSEHHGRDFDLRRMGSQECQTCHKQQFASFAEGHPEFTSYPYERRTRLQFDHRTHWQKHFNDAKFAAVAPTSCTVCHEPVEDGRQMRVKNFEQTARPVTRPKLPAKARRATRGSHLPAAGVRPRDAPPGRVRHRRLPGVCGGRAHAVHALDARGRSRGQIRAGDARRCQPRRSHPGHRGAESGGGAVALEREGSFRRPRHPGAGGSRAAFGGHRQDRPGGDRTHRAVAGRQHRPRPSNLAAGLLTEVAAHRRGEALPGSQPRPPRLLRWSPLPPRPLRPATTCSSPMSRQSPSGGERSGKPSHNPALADAEQRYHMAVGTAADETYTLLLPASRTRRPHPAARFDTSVREKSPRRRRSSRSFPRPGRPALPETPCSRSGGRR